MEPEIKTLLPGPRAAALIARDEAVTSPSLTRSYPLVIERGEGCWVWDVDGNRFLDFTAGVAVCATGHAHPQVVAAIREQSGKFLHMCGSDFYYEPMVALCERLARLAPGGSAKRVFLANSGAEAVEAALKLARYATGREEFIAFHGAFHGRTIGALSLNASKPIHRERYGELLDGVHFVPYPSAYRGQSTAATMDHINAIVVERANDVAAVVVESIQGEGGYLVPPDDFLPALRTLCDERGILLVVDEVQSGLGRTGKFFACEHVGVAPDVICFAKGIASGLPLGGIIARADLMQWQPGAHASTFGGNPVACAAALATLDLVEGGLMDNAARIGELMLTELRKLIRACACVGDARGRGLMLGVEIVSDRSAKTPAPQLRDDIVQRCFERGLLLLPCGANVVRFCPPLVVTEDEARVALSVFADSAAFCCR